MKTKKVTVAKATVAKATKGANATKTVAKRTIKPSVKAPVKPAPVKKKVVASKQMPTSKDVADVILEISHVSSKNKHDYSKYNFHKNIFNKRQLVLSMIRDYTIKHPELTTADLAKIFGEKVIKPVGKVRTETVILKAIGKNKMDRYFIKKEQLIKAGDDVFFTITNQWTKAAVDNFLATAVLLGYNVQKAGSAA